MVGTGCVLHGRFDPRKLPVYFAQGGERIGALYPRVVGHLIVAKERRVGDRPPGIDVTDQRLHLKVALDHRRPSPEQGIGKCAANARLDVPTTLLRRAPTLAYYVADEQDERARDVIGVCEVGEVILADPPRTIAPQHSAHRQEAVRRITGEKVRAAGPAAGEKAMPVRHAPLDFHRISWM